MTEPIEFSFLGKLHIGPGVALDYFYFRFKSWVALGYMKLCHIPNLTTTESLDALGAPDFIFKSILALY